MSMTRCDACERIIDSDFDTDCYDIPGKCLCVVCREDEPEADEIRLTTHHPDE